jgi:hypothetical protein
LWGFGVAKWRLCTVRGGHRMHDFEQPVSRLVAPEWPTLRAGRRRRNVSRQSRAADAVGMAQPPSERVGPCRPRDSSDEALVAGACVLATPPRLSGQLEDGEAAPSSANGTDPLRPPGHRRLVRPVPARPAAAGDGSDAARLAHRRRRRGWRTTIGRDDRHVRAARMRIVPPRGRCLAHVTRLAGPDSAPPADAACQNLGCAPGAAPLPGAPARVKSRSSPSPAP